MAALIMLESPQSPTHGYTYVLLPVHLTVIICGATITIACTDQSWLE